MVKNAEIGVFGGSGFYEFLKNAESIKVKTPYGPPADDISIVKINGKKVAFLPRHGKRHQYPPHKIPYQANIFAMKMLGVKQIIAPCAAGSLQFDIKPGSFVICDQFVDLTRGRADTYFDGPKLMHIQSVDAYCPQLREHAAENCKKLNISCRHGGTVVVVQGPRFSSAAESAWYSKIGWQVINMTQYPEAILAHELGMCYLNISLITDYDAGLVGKEKIKPVTYQEVLKVFNQNNAELKKLIVKMIESWPAKRTCRCRLSSAEAKMK